MRSKNLRFHLGLVLLLASIPVVAGTSKLMVRAEHAQDVLNDIIRIPENNIPIGLLKKSHAIAVVPSVVKAGFIVGGSWGRGLVAQRLSDGSWSLPVYVSLAGGSVGLQIGVQSTDVVLLFTTQRSVNGLLDGTFKLGGDASIAAGPVGRQATAATNLKLDAEIYSYSRSRGLFGGLALDGSVLNIDYDSTEKVYGTGVTPRAVFAGKVTNRPATLIEFTNLLEEISAMGTAQAGVARN